MSKINVGDIELYFESYGSGEPLIFIGGFSVDHLVWQTVVDKFAENYRVIIFDNRGTGQSSCPDMPYTIDILAEDVIGLCKALDIEKAYFIGSSMGGMILQTIAYRYPQFVKAAVLGNTNSKTDVRFSTFLRGVDELMKRDVDRKIVAQLMLPWAFSMEYLSQEGVIEMLIQLSLANPFPFTHIGFKNQRQALQKFNSRSWLNQIHVPCLVISGNKDIIFDESEVAELAKQIPKAAYYSFKNVGHVPHIERPEEFYNRVIDFFAGVRPREIF